MTLPVPLLLRANQSTPLTVDQMDTNLALLAQAIQDVNAKALARSLKEAYGADETGATSSSASLTNALTALQVIEATPGAAYKVKDVAFTHNQGLMGNLARFAAEAGGTHMLRLSGFNTEVSDIYVSDGTVLSGAVVFIGEGLGQSLEDATMVNVGAGAVKLAPVSGSCATPYLTNVLAYGITGYGVEIASSVNDGQFIHNYMSGVADYVLGLGRPRTGTIGWWQHTPPVSGLAVGGHTVTGLTCITLHEGMHLTDAQYSKFSSCTVDSCRSYGLIVDGASYRISFEDFFCGTSRGIRVSGSAQVSFDGLTTTLNGVIPPWGQIPFYDAGTIYDITVQNTAQVWINGDEWHGDKRVFVDPTAKLTVSGGQWMPFRSGGTVNGGTTTFLTPDGVTAVEQDATYRVQKDGWLFVGQANQTAAPGASKFTTYNIRLSGSLALSVVVGNSDTGNTAWAYAVPVLKGQEVSVQVVHDIGAAAAKLEIDVQCLGV